MNASIVAHDDVQKAMRAQMDRIKIRTLAGRDVNGFPFLRKKDGSPSYLHKTGNLLRSLQADAVESGRGLVGRVRVTGRARGYAPIVNQSRKFMSASRGEREQVVKDIVQSMRDRRNDA